MLPELYLGRHKIAVPVTSLIIPPQPYVTSAERPQHPRSPARCECAVQIHGSHTAFPKREVKIRRHLRTCEQRDIDKRQIQLLNGLKEYASGGLRRIIPAVITESDPGIKIMRPQRQSVHKSIRAEVHCIRIIIAGKSAGQDSAASPIEELSLRPQITASERSKIALIRGIGITQAPETARTVLENHRILQQKITRARIPFAHDGTRTGKIDREHGHRTDRRFRHQRIRAAAVRAHESAHGQKPCFLSVHHTVQRHDGEPTVLRRETLPGMPVVIPVHSILDTGQISRVKFLRLRHGRGKQQKYSYQICGGPAHENISIPD